MQRVSDSVGRYAPRLTLRTREMISELNTSPVQPRANASPAPYTGSRRMTRDRSGSLRLTTWWTFTTSSMPVFTGAFAHHSSRSASRH